MNGADIFKFLCGLKLDFSSFDWLENRGLSEFEMLVSVVLTQNTSWNNVLKALANVRAAKIHTLKELNALEVPQIATLIKPSGFYNTKAKRLKTLLEAVDGEFSDFADFKERVSREWLIGVKGLGFESVDSILNYICKREILVVDSYTKRLAAALGYEFESYDEMREFFESGVEIYADEICTLLNAQNSLNLRKNEREFAENLSEFKNSREKNLSKTSEFGNEKNENLSASKIVCEKNKNLNVGEFESKKDENLSASKFRKYELFELYQIFHAQIIAFGKAYFKGANLNDEGRKIIAKFKAEF